LQISLIKKTSDYVHGYLSNLVDAATIYFKLPTFDFEIKIFSDTIVVGAETGRNPMEFREFLLYINSLQLATITAKELGELPLRGAISRGDFFTNDKDLTFGKVLVKAHKLESELANYPRIIVDPNELPDELNPEKSRKSTEFTNKLLTQTGFDKKLKGGLKAFDEYSYPVRRDFDGLLHCNYLTAIRMVDGGWASNAKVHIDEHRQFIIKKLSEAPNERVASKYNWMKSYHNWFCSGYPETHEYRIED